VFFFVRDIRDIRDIRDTRDKRDLRDEGEQFTKTVKLTFNVTQAVSGSACP
jgi:hypothetical protein